MQSKSCWNEAVTHNKGLSCLFPLQEGRWEQSLYYSGRVPALWVLITEKNIITVMQKPECLGRAFLVNRMFWETKDWGGGIIFSTLFGSF